MVRGSQTLFKDIFPIEAPEKQRKGRSIAYDILRNECLINSYWFIGNETGLRFELIIKIVARQFWISQRTVSNILQFNHHLLVNVRVYFLRANK